MKLYLVLAFAVLTAVAPAVAESHPISAHVRTQTYHDRSPHVHDRGSQPHHQA